MDAFEQALAHMEEQQRSIEAVQRELQRMEISGQSRGREVTAVVRGTGQFVAIRIDARALDRFSPEGIGLLVLEAINDSMRRLADVSRSKFAPLIAAAEAAIPASDKW